MSTSSVSQHTDNPLMGEDTFEMPKLKKGSADSVDSASTSHVGTVLDAEANLNRWVRRRDLSGRERWAIEFSEALAEEGFKKYVDVGDFKFDDVTDDRILDDHPDDDSEARSSFESEVSGGETSLALRNTGDGEGEVRRQLEKLQIQAIISLVEPISIEENGTSFSKMFLFLTNSQAREYVKNHISRVDRLLMAMDIPKPSLIINLIGSFPGQQKTGQYGSETSYSNSWSTILSHHTHSEMDGSALQQTDLRMEDFLRNAVLQVAIHTKALVLCSHTQCMMSVAFNRVVKKYQKSIPGGKLPFSVLHLNTAAKVYYSSTRPGQTAHSLKHSSKRWRRSMDLIKDASPTEVANQQSADCPAYCSHYIIIDGVDQRRRKPDSSPFKDFLNSMVQQLSAELPSIAITAMCPIGGIQYVTDYVSRGLPCMAMDTFRPPRDQNSYASTVADAGRDLLDLENKLILSGTRNKWDSGILAHMHAVLARMKAQRHLRSQRKSGDAQKFDDQADVNGPIWKVIADQEALKADSGEENASDDEDSEAVEEAVNIIVELLRLRRKVTRFWEMKLIQRSIDALNDRLTEDAQDDHHRKKIKTDKDALLQGINAWLLDMTYDWRYHFEQDVEVQENLYKQFGANPSRPPEARFLCYRMGRYDGAEFNRVLMIWPETKVPPDEIVQSLLGCLETRRKQADAEWKTDVLPEELKSRKMQDYKSALLSPRLHSGNLHNMKQLSRDLNKVARIDRLPESNSDQAMMTLRHAWDLVDVYTAEGASMKIVAKLSYIMMVLVAFLSSTLVVVSLNTPNADDASSCSCCYMNATTPTSVNQKSWWHMNPEQLSHAVIILSLLASFVAATTTYIDPSQRWMQLRGAALNLESEIWKFRTRTGKYALTSSKELQSKQAEEELKHYSEELKQHVGKAASVSGTSFYAKFEFFANPKPASLKVYQHGQYEECDVGGTYGAAKFGGDDHHSPLHPERYLRLRVEPMVRFYQARLPTYYRIRSVSEVLMIVGSLSGTLMSFLGIAEWSAIASAATVALTAWIAFHDTARKISRYNNTVEKLSSVMVWWHSLTPMEQASVNTVDDLVSECEELFEREREAWQSTSMTTKLLKKQATVAADRTGVKDKSEFVESTERPTSGLSSVV